ncbi:MAG: lytic murein transglycosylase [Pseudomonadota bacterium]
MTRRVQVGNQVSCRGDTRRAAVVLASCLAIVPALSTFISASGHAAPPPETFAQFRTALWPDARAAGISRQTFDRALRTLKPDLALPDLERPARAGDQAKKKRGQPEFIKPPRDYLSPRMLANLTARGRIKEREYAKPLAEIRRRFNVAPEVVLAIWGRETAFGGYRLKHDAIRAIATQAWTGRRRQQFRAELILALKILEEKRTTRTAMRSSWAGAMGPTQLLPSNYYDHAVDLDGDGDKDIWSSVPDALGAAAKSLIDNGWQPDRTWGWEIRKPKTFDCAQEGPDKKRPLSAWIAEGYTRTFDRQWPQDALAEDAYLLLPEGARGPAFLMHNNFLVLKSYNFADLYALFVGNLADRIAGGGKFETAWATTKRHDKSRIADIQRWLNAANYPAGQVDGRAGTITRSAIGAYQKAEGLTLDCYPSRAVWQHLRQARQ